MQTLTVSVIDASTSNLWRILFHESPYPRVFWRLNRNFLQVIRLQWREFEKMKERFLKTWKNERKVLLTSKNLKKGSWIAAPLPCTSVLWGQKMKNKNRKKLPLFKDGCIFFLSNLLSWPQRRFSCYCTLPVPIILWQVMNLQIEEGL